ncbi:MAG: hypothetical protein A2607_01660 [Candidatus Vogelbacteria bacterium RIFOXYD1_FULL_42_15]|uniref:Uncharacterized protein n=1 Tax=Candidatus Vogelbacteria bacterium RIFOXYD1_FULL_42_15 TaxID=1802437 RepID=A0A1G2QI46_9BACT|nr:MAG: hypothetical protein A2607_01660 [Candidatus Vogelbacteria bacterium RIFOXYD1_FULL_42_15]
MSKDLRELCLIGSRWPVVWPPFASRLVKVHRSIEMCCWGGACSVPFWYDVPAGVYELELVHSQIHPEESWYVVELFPDFRLGCTVDAWEIIFLASGWVTPLATSN